MRLVHGRTAIELHELRGEAGLPLLLLHELGANATTWDESAMATWPGRVFALDFAGHGASEFVAGNAYTPEQFLAEADIALQAISPTGECALVGAGIGGYVALMLAAARREQVRAALLLPGRGLDGGGAVPDYGHRTIRTLEEWEEDTAQRAAHYLPGTDPEVAACETDVRPDDYAKGFAQGARRLLLSEAVSRQPDVPSWWHHVTGAPTSAAAPTAFTSALRALRDACNEENPA